jgi:histidine triad (HIT) family protein
MHNHEPQDYDCPFCRIIKRAKLQSDRPSDVVYSSETVTAFLSLGRWTQNPVDVLIVPNDHFENIFDLPFEYIPDIHRLTRAIALSMKMVYQCDGISTRQHNEPAGDQDVWHYHVHITPRFTQDNFYCSKRTAFPEPERFEHARRLREFMKEHTSELFGR